MTTVRGHSDAKKSTSSHGFGHSHFKYKEHVLHQLSIFCFLPVEIIHVHNNGSQEHTFLVCLTDLYNDGTLL